MKPVTQWTKTDLIEFLKGVDKRTWLALGAGAAGFAVIWALLIGPAWFERPRLRKEIQNMDAQMRQFNALNQKRLTWEENEKLFSKIIADAKARLYEEEDIALLLGQVSRLANESGVDVVASKPIKDSVKFPAPYQDQYRAFCYDFTMQGKYHALAKLAAGIESNPKLIRIRKIHIVSVSESPDRHIAEFEVAANAAAPRAVAGALNAQKK